MANALVPKPGVPGALQGGERQAKPGRRADIQGLRAIAVLLVVAFHAGLPVPGGFIGVDMFFVISGFVIAGMLLRQLEQTAKLGFASFYARRMRRLLPALALLTAVTAVASVFLLSPLGPQQLTAKTGIAASLFSANVQLSRAGGGGYFDLATETNALLHTWSLSVEEQFYLIFPAFLVVASGFAKRVTARRSLRRTAAAFVLVATAASLALSGYLTSHPSDRLGSAFAFYSPFTRAWEFGVGALLALGAPTLIRLTLRFTAPYSIVGVALIGFGAIRFNGATAFPGFAALVPVVGTALLLTAGMSTNRGVSSLLGMRPAVWIGDVSYGWYLWHWPLIVFAAALRPGNTWVLVGAAAGSLAPTWLSYRFVENPIRFNDRLTGRRVIYLVLVCIAVPIAACVGLLFANKAEARSEAVRSFSVDTRPHGEGKRGCYSSMPIGKRPSTDCTWSVEQPRGTIYLVGDSNAAQFSEPVTAAANQLGYNLTVAVGTGCSFADVVRESAPAVGFDGPACHRFVTESIPALTAARPALVIIAMSSSQVVNGPGYLSDPHSGETARTPEAKAKLWENGLVSVFDQLADAKIPTLLIHAVPDLGDLAQDWQAEACPAVRIYTHSCGTSIDRERVDRQQQPARDAEIRALARVPGAASGDFTSDLCSPVECATDRHGMSMYLDATHLSVDGALTLTDRFHQLISDHAAPR